MNHRQKLSANGTLLISELNELTDAGQYSCQAKSAGSDSLASNHVHVSIKGEPPLRHRSAPLAARESPTQPEAPSPLTRGPPRPQPKTVPPVLEPFAFARSLHRGQRYNVMCTVVRGDLPVSIRWFKDGRPILADFGSAGQEEPPPSSSSANGGQADELAGLAIRQLDPYSSTLTFASLQPQHRGQYSCEAQNEAGRANQSSTLVIHGECRVALLVAQGEPKQKSSYGHSLIGLSRPRTWTERI